ncbi:MAG: galactokinase [Candidatus Rokubacteria bacterium]|nr:galactokinase [Candidatus Rokubacteria bacterium]
MILARAPLRITLGGGGTDLPSYYTRHRGFVLSAAINKYVYIYVNRPAADTLLRVKYSRYEQVSSVDEIQHDLVRPALKLLGVDGALEIVSMADVPDGTGLGSSGSYLVAVLTALHELKRERIPTQDLAELAVHIEMDLARHPVGKQDHYLAAFGGITCLEIAQSGAVAVTPLTLGGDDAEELRRWIVLFFTGLQRSSREILGAQDADTREAKVTILDSLHRTKEIGYRIKEALERGDLPKFGQLLEEHWQNKKRRSDRISDVKIDRWYDLARTQGALGGKLVGAGGGGFLMLCCPPSVRASVREALAAEGLREMPFAFDFEGAKVLVNF